MNYSNSKKCKIQDNERGGGDGTDSSTKKKRNTNKMKKIVDNSKES